MINGLELFYNFLNEYKGSLDDLDKFYNKKEKLPLDEEVIFGFLISGYTLDLIAVDPNNVEKYYNPLNLYYKNFYLKNFDINGYFEDFSKYNFDSKLLTYILRHHVYKEKDKESYNILFDKFMNNFTTCKLIKCGTSEGLEVDNKVVDSLVKQCRENENEPEYVKEFQKHISMYFEMLLISWVVSRYPDFTSFALNQTNVHKLFKEKHHLDDRWW